MTGGCAVKLNYDIASFLIINVGNGLFYCRHLLIYFWCHCDKGMLQSHH